MNRRPPPAPAPHKGSSLPDEYHLPPPATADGRYAPPPGEVPENLHAHDAQALHYWHQALQALRQTLSGRRR